MRFKNYTDIPDQRVRKLLRFASKGIRHTRVYVEVYNTRYGNANGKIYTDKRGGKIVFTRKGKTHIVEALIKLRIPKVYPHPLWDYPPDVPQTKEESLVWIMAHEICHLKQARSNRKRSFAKRRKRVFCQKPCNEWANRRLEALRTFKEEMKWEKRSYVARTASVAWRT